MQFFHCTVPAAIYVCYNQWTKNHQSLPVIIFELSNLLTNFCCWLVWCFLYWEIREFFSCIPVTIYLHVYFKYQWGFWIYFKCLVMIKKQFARQMYLSAWSLDLRVWWCLLRTLGINTGLWMSTVLKILGAFFLWLRKKKKEVKEL